MPLQIRWYGLMYVAGFVIGYIFYRRNLSLKKLTLDRDTYEGLIFALMLGVILGGRLGYILFYNLPYYFLHPLEILQVWQGGMSFHGGALGVIIAGGIFARRHKLEFYRYADPAMPLVAIGLGLGRLGNFINGELYGRVTSVPWAMIFPDSDGQPRHPTQLYEMFLEGIVLAIVSQYVYRKSKIEGLGFWTFIGGYGIFRLLIEFVRQPDDIDLYKNGLFFGFVTMGMVLSFVMFAAAIAGIVYLVRRQRHSPQV
jgi:phosphatidylglycerol:prolipoprotein diacylglycerol transferase